MRGNGARFINVLQSQASHTRTTQAACKASQTPLGGTVQHKPALMQAAFGKDMALFEQSNSKLSRKPDVDHGTPHSPDWLLNVHRRQGTPSTRHDKVEMAPSARKARPLREPSRVTRRSQAGRRHGSVGGTHAHVDTSDSTSDGGNSMHGRASFPTTCASSRARGALLLMSPAHATTQWYAA